VHMVIMVARQEGSRGANRVTVITRFRVAESRAFWVAIRLELAGFFPQFGDLPVNCRVTAWRRIWRQWVTLPVARQLSCVSNGFYWLMTTSRAFPESIPLSGTFTPCATRMKLMTAQ
jgi:hypothetical protein